MWILYSFLFRSVAAIFQSPTDAPCDVLDRSVVYDQSTCHTKTVATKRDVYSPTRGGKQISF